MSWTLEQARLASGLSKQDLWLACFALGGSVSERQLDDLLDGVLEADPISHDVVAQALNERLHDLGRDWPVPYLSR